MNMFPTEDSSAVSAARSLRPGATVDELKDVLGEPDHRQNANGRLFFLYRNPPMALTYYSIAQIDPLTGRVISLRWGGPEDGWSTETVEVKHRRHVHAGAA